MVQQAAENGFEAYAWQIAWSLNTFLAPRGLWQDQLATQRVALAAAEKIDDLAGQAAANRLLARALTRLGDHDAAEYRLERALELHERLGDPTGQAQTLHNYCELCYLDGRLDEALAHGREALRLYRSAGNRSGKPGRSTRSVGCWPPPATMSRPSKAARKHSPSNDGATTATARPQRWTASASPTTASATATARPTASSRRSNSFANPSTGITRRKRSSGSGTPGKEWATGPLPLPPGARPCGSTRIRATPGPRRPAAASNATDWKVSGSSPPSEKIMVVTSSPPVANGSGRRRPRAGLGIRAGSRQPAPFRPAAIVVSAGQPLAVGAGR
ncbi:tetratricopeptide repeat protein [Plantactinospora veratri]